MGASALTLGAIKYAIKPLSLDDFDQAARQMVAAGYHFSVCELEFSVRIEFVQIEGAIVPPLSGENQEFWPALIEEFKRVNPISVPLTLRMQELVVRTPEKKSGSENG